MTQEEGYFLSEFSSLIFNLNQNKINDREGYSNLFNIVRRLKFEDAEMELIRKALAEPFGKHLSEAIGVCHGLLNKYNHFNSNFGFGGLLAFPAWQLVRITGQGREPVAWSERWVSAGGVLTGKKMIALKTDPIWKNISRFKLPYPPFEFFSYMDVDDVSIDTCERMKLVPKGWMPPRFFNSATLTENFHLLLGDSEWVKKFLFDLCSIKKR